MATSRSQNFDVVVVGSGFGGSVAALRLREKGYSVAVLVAGKRFEDKDLPKPSESVNQSWNREVQWCELIRC